MVRFAYFDFLVIADGPGKAGSQWHFFTLEGCGHPIAMVAGWGIAACVGPLCLGDMVLEGNFFEQSSSCCWGGLESYMVYFMGGCQVRDLKLYYT